jgi:hypothetical protein
MGDIVQPVISDLEGETMSTRTEPDQEVGPDTGVISASLRETGPSQAELQALVDRFWSTGTGITITGEGRVITFPMDSDAVVGKLEIVKGTDAWQYHNNSFYSDCILEIEGLPRMHAIAGEADTAPVVIRWDPRGDLLKRWIMTLSPLLFVRVP